MASFSAASIMTISLLYNYVSLLVEVFYLFLASFSTHIKLPESALFVKAVNELRRMACDFALLGPKMKSLILR